MSTEEMTTDVSEAVVAADPSVDSESPPSKKAKTESLEGPQESTETSKETEEASEETQEESKERGPELSRYWKVVEENNDDFTGWTQLLQHVDANESIDEARLAFDAFLHRYPYCYGYWKKYADLERRHESPRSTVSAVFERGVRAIGLSVDLWLHYLNYAKAEHKEDLEAIRDVYERAMASCGVEFRSDKIWDNYVKFEIENKAWPRVLSLYGRILRNRTQGLGHQFEMFRDFVKEHNPRDMLDDEAFLKLRRETLEAKINDDLDEPRPLTLDEEIEAMREKLINDHRAIYKETEEASKSIQPFEDNIRRPYFHMKPLEKGQLKNWHAYLDNEMAKEEENVARCEIVFERCLIACALYEQFWTKYIDWLDQRLSKADTEADLTKKQEIESKMRDVFNRATNHHLPKKVDIHVKFAAFEEAKGNYEASAQILDNIIEKHPQLISLALRRINLERRRGDFEAAIKLFEKTIDDEKTSKSFKSDLKIKLARLHRFPRQNVDEARRVLNEALKDDDQNSKLHLQLLDLELHSQPLDLDAVVSVLDRAVECFKSDAKQQVLFARRKADLLEDFGQDVRAVNEARRELIALQSSIKGDQDKKGLNGIPTTTTTASTPTVNSSATVAQGGYTAQHANAYQQYGSRYAYPNANTATTNNPQTYYNNYYQQTPPQQPQSTATNQAYPSGYYGSTYQQ